MKVASPRVSAPFEALNSIQAHLKFASKLFLGELTLIPESFEPHRVSCNAGWTALSFRFLSPCS